MGKPIIDITITTLDGKSGQVKAIFDTGSFYTIIRENKVPAGASIVREGALQQFRTAGSGGKLQINGVLPIAKITIGDKKVEDSILVSPDLVSDMLLGAKTMQAWDISIQNKKGKTSISVGHDMRDPEITEVD